MVAKILGSIFLQIYHSLPQIQHNGKSRYMQMQLKLAPIHYFICKHTHSGQWLHLVIHIKWVSSQIRRLYLLLTVKESAIDVPTNLEARRRITFFTNSLFMYMPHAPRVRNMLSFRCILQFMWSFTPVNYLSSPERLLLVQLLKITTECWPLKSIFF